MNELCGPSDTFVLAKMMIPHFVQCNSHVNCMGGGEGVQKTSG